MVRILGVEFGLGKIRRDIQNIRAKGVAQTQFARQTIASAEKRYGRQPGLQTFTVPTLFPAGAERAGARGIVRSAGNAVQRVGSYIERNVNPVALGKRAVVAPLLFEGANLISSSITNTPFNPFPTGRTFKGILGYVTGGLPAAAIGLFESGAITAKQVANFVENKAQNLPIPTPTNFPTIPNLPSPSTIFNFPASPLGDVGLPQTPSAAFAPSISVGGLSGGSDLAPLLLALLGGGALGYFAGKRKKKRARYKKRRKH